MTNDNFVTLFFIEIDVNSQYAKRFTLLLGEEMNILVSGSLAYDRIMDFPGKFTDHILPEKVHVLNVCFMINELKGKLWRYSREYRVCTFTTW